MRASRTLTGIGVYSTLSDGLTLTGFDRPEKLATAYVSGGFFATVGAAAAHGRTLGPADAEGDDRVVVLSDALWRRRLGADPAIVGRPLTLDGEPMTVAGVMPPSFRFPGPRSRPGRCGVALAACLVPARHAAATDPMSVLREG